MFGTTCNDARGCREPWRLTFGLESTSVIVAEPYTANRDPIAGLTSRGTTVSYYPATWKI